MYEEIETNTSHDAPADEIFKGISLTPVITSIFKPSADLVGKELRDVIKEKIDSAKNRRKAENLKEHIKKVGEKLERRKKYSSPSLSTIRQLNLFEKWVEGAENVDPTDQILSNIWQELLVQISEGYNPSEISIEKMKLLQAEDAKLLLRLRKKDI